MARKDLWDTESKRGKETNAYLIEFAKVAASAVCESMNNPKSAIYKYLPQSGQMTAFEHCPDELKKRGEGMWATNDGCESALGGATRNLQKGNMANHKPCAGQSDAKRNNILGRGVDGKPRSVFQQWPEPLQYAVLIAAIEHAPALRCQNNEDLERQQQAKMEKEEIMKAKGLNKSMKDYAEACLYHGMYKSAACITDPEVLTQTLNKLKSDKKRRDLLKDNINIRLKGGGGKYKEDFDIRWTYKRRTRTVQELQDHLRKILEAEGAPNSEYTMPKEAPIQAPKRMDVPILGTMTEGRRKLDSDQKEVEEKIKTMLRRERAMRKEEPCEIDRHQPWLPPDASELEGQRIDVYWPIKGMKVKEWCQGLVKSVGEIDGDKICLSVLWDATPDLEGFEMASESDVVLRLSSFGTKRSFGWRLDLGFELAENVFSEEELAALELEDSTDIVCDDEVVGERDENYEELCGDLSDDYVNSDGEMDDE
jgi:hypothetical protein